MTPRLRNLFRRMFETSEEYFARNPEARVWVGPEGQLKANHKHVAEMVRKFIAARRDARKGGGRG